MRTMMTVAALALATGNVVLTARAQAPGTMALLVGNAEYDAVTGALINPNFLQGPPVALVSAVASDTSLYVENGTPNVPGYNIAKYDLRTGALINPNFVPLSPQTQIDSALGGLGFSGVMLPSPFALKGNALYVLEPGNSISTYDATTGALITANFVAGFYGGNFSSVEVVGNVLLISGDLIGFGVAGHTVTFAYDATTGAPVYYLAGQDNAYLDGEINELVSPPVANLTTLLTASADGNWYLQVINAQGGTIAKYELPQSGGTHLVQRFIDFQSAYLVS
jgi:hypothetical protein